MQNTVFWFCVITIVAYLWNTNIKQGPIYESSKSLKGKTVLLTGGNTGIGKETAKEIARRGAKLIIASRNTIKSEKAKHEIIEETGNKNIKVVQLDLEDLQSVRLVASELLKSEPYIDYLVNNAGAMFLQGLTKNGLSRVFAVNHLGHFLLTNLLMKKFKQQSNERPVRIINVASDAYMVGSLDFETMHYDAGGFLENLKLYADSKLANIYFTKELSNKLQNFPNITTYAVHPGIIFSDLGGTIPNKYMPIVAVLAYPFLRATKYGIQTTMYTILDDNIEHLSGKYFSECGHQMLMKHATDEALAAELWEKSMKMVELTAEDL